MSGRDHPAARAAERSPFGVRLLATGGTIEKTYDATSGALILGEPIIERLLDTLVHPDMRVEVERLMALDSLDMTDDDRKRLVTAVAECVSKPDHNAVVISHGTDTLAETAAALVDALGTPRVPVLLTGAMRPWRTADSDAAQNIAQALIACRLLPPGVYAVFHGRVIAGERVIKDYARLTLADRHDPR